MAKRYIYATELTWGGDEPTAELEVEVSFTVAWGRPETPPAYSHGGLPAEPDEIDDIQVELIDGKLPADATAGEYMPGATVAAIIEAIEGSERHLEAMLIEAREHDDALADEAAERRYEAMRDDAGWRVAV